MDEIVNIVEIMNYINKKIGKLKANNSSQYRREVMESIGTGNFFYWSFSGVWVKITKSFTMYTVETDHF